MREGLACGEDLLTVDCMKREVEGLHVIAGAFGGVKRRCCGMYCTVLYCTEAGGSTECPAVSARWEWHVKF